MKLEHFLLLMIATAVAGTACSVEASSSSAGGDDGAGGEIGGKPSATSGQAATSTGTSAGIGAGGADGIGGSEFPADCADTHECGNFGGGCVKCEAKSMCATEYQACFDDAPCNSYAGCLASCDPSELECVQACESQFPTGATEYQALTRCVLCGACAALCDHAPDICK